MHPVFIYNELITKFQVTAPSNNPTPALPNREGVLGEAQSKAIKTKTTLFVSPPWGIRGLNTLFVKIYAVNACKPI
jgi:hypothetical protein